MASIVCAHNKKVLSDTPKPTKYTKTNKWYKNL